MKKLQKLLPTLLSSLILVACSNDTGVAEVNGRTISSAEFDAYLKHKRIPGDNAKRRAAALNQYLEREALAQTILEQDYLDEQTVAVEVNEFKKEMVISRYFDAFLKDKASAQAIENYFKANPDLYRETKIHVAHILVRTNRRMDETQRQAKLTTANDIYSQLRAGADFGELAKEVSEDKISGVKGGDLGWMKKGVISPAFSEKIFSMKNGELSEPFMTSFGFHIIKTLEGEQVLSKAFETVRGDIRYQLRNEAKQAELERLKAAARIESFSAEAANSNG